MSLLGRYSDLTSSDMGWGPSWDADARLGEVELERQLREEQGRVGPARLHGVPEPDTDPAQRADTPAVQVSDLTDMAKPDLRIACRNRGLTQGGTSDDLRTRLAAHLTSGEQVAPRT